jgi:hypothetical protein
MEKLLYIEVEGKEKKWSFNFMGDPKHLEDWRADGLEVGEIVASYDVDKNTLPVFLGLLTK